MAFGFALAACGGDAVDDAGLGESSNAAVYCPDFSQTLPMTQSAPWGAVGYLNDGCTATLIDGYHILTAAHCVRNGNTGAWVPNADFSNPLRFYPNFHPSRPNAPRYRVSRSVVGSLTQDGDNTANRGFMPSDWAISRLDCDTDSQGTQWCPPVTGFPSLALVSASSWQGESVSRAGYDRDKTKLAPDALCPPANAQDEADSCPGACPCSPPVANWWWQNGFVDPACVVNSPNDNGWTDDFLVSSCSTRGGASGSPIVTWWSQSVGYAIRGVVHGAGWTTPEDTPCENPGQGHDYVTGAAGVMRFAHAPRFAKNVAISRHESGANRTQVWAVDGDADAIRTRSRKSASLTNGFSTWDVCGAVTAPDRIAANRLTNFRPDVLVTTTTGTLFYRYMSSGGSWQSWASFATPPGRAIRDVDATLDSASIPYFFGVDNIPGGYAYRRRRTGSGAYDPWNGWQLLVTSYVNDAYARVSSIRRHGDLVQEMFLVTTSGAVRWAAEPFPVSAPSDFQAPATIVDLDAGWLWDNRVFVVAVDDQGHLWLRTQTATSGNGWNSWITFDPPVGPPIYAPATGCAGSAPPGIVSVTASRWQDDPVSTVVPVIFATDNQGNVYYTTYETGPCTQSGCDCGTYWQPWKSFYHAKRWADYEP